ncbi:BQ2448_1011 [Microbotryum intermedium]|uniref:BQ2448_1011 protein n=1 Tax=Microbotryum intermedium TaxID=269621 RepID=A0A238F4I4_9BASI|nr:BQ2448_1011 [Microbotryum intermedium]
MQLFTFLIAAAPALASFASASSLTAEQMAVEKRFLFKYCCNGKLWKRDDPESLEKRTFCLRKRTFWIHKCPTDPTVPTCNPLNCPKPPSSQVFCTSGQCDFSCQDGTTRVGSTCVKLCTPSSCPAVDNATPVCKDGQTCDFTCNSGFNKVDGKCVPICDAAKCPVVPNSQAFCNNNNCDFTCNSGYTKRDGKCVKDCDVTKCPPVLIGGQAICTEEGNCDVVCYSGYGKRDGKCTPDCDANECPSVPYSTRICINNKCDFNCNSDYTKRDGKCVKDCDVTKCPTVQYGEATCTSNGKCDFTCRSGYKKSNGKCVPKTPVCDVTKCPAVTYGQAICNSDGKCDFTCNPTYNKVDGKCVPTIPVEPTCDPSKCPTCANGTPVCTNNKCDLRCDAGFTKKDGQCVRIPVPTCTKKTVAFYDNFQSTADGLPAVTVASIDACAAYCLSKNCASFDFWDGNQCGIQVGGGGFDGFHYSAGVVHGVPGECSDYTTQCPEKVAVKACYNKSVCPSTSARLRRSHSKRRH